MANVFARKMGKEEATSKPPRRRGASMKPPQSLIRWVACLPLLPPTGPDPALRGACLVSLTVAAGSASPAARVGRTDSPRLGGRREGENAFDLDVGEGWKAKIAFNVPGGSGGGEDVSKMEARTQHAFGPLDLEPKRL